MFKNKCRNRRIPGPVGVGGNDDQIFSGIQSTNIRKNGVPFRVPGVLSTVNTQSQKTSGFQTFEGFLNGDQAGVGPGGHTVISAGKIAEVKYDTVCGIGGNIPINVRVAVPEYLSDVREPGGIQTGLGGDYGLFLNIKGQNPSGISHQAAEKGCVMAVSGGGINTEGTFRNMVGNKLVTKISHSKSLHGTPLCFHYFSGLNISITGKRKKVKAVKFHNFFKNKDGNPVVEGREMCYDKENDMERKKRGTEKKMDVYVENIVGRETTQAQRTMLTIWKIICGASLFMFCVMPMGGQLILSLLNLIMFIVSLCIVGYFSRKLSLMYEYTYANGEICFSRMTTNRRKKLFTCHMEKVEQVCFYKEFREPGQKAAYAKTRDYGTGTASDNLYVMIVRTDKGKEKIYFEPDAAFLDAMWRNSPRTVSKKRY